MNAFHYLRAVLVLILIVLNTLILIVPLYLLTLLKMLFKGESAQVSLAKGLARIAETWISINDVIINLISRPRYLIQGADNLERNQWYFVTSNHQSWADILVLQHVLNRRIPLLKFFLKQELIKVPFLGHAWWALDFPFMKRYTREEIERDPSLKGKDLETTRKACEKFAYFPTSVMNFFEGTRFTPEKHDKQGSPYKHLLKPKSGGTAFTLNAMGGRLAVLLDVTIVYPPGASTNLMAYLGGAVKDIDVIVSQRPIPSWTSQGDYQEDPVFRESFQQWISDIWREKDELIDARLNKRK